MTTDKNFKNHQSPCGIWLMLMPQDNGTCPSSYITKITSQEIINYTFDELLYTNPLQIDIANQQLILNDTHKISYEFLNDRILKKTGIFNEEPNLTTYIKLLPTNLHCTIHDVLKKQYILRSQDTQINMGDYIFDFSNSNPHISIDINIDTILGTHFIIGTSYSKRKEWIFPIKEIHQNHLVVYGFDPLGGYTTLYEHIPEEKITIEGRADVFIPPKLDLLINELKEQKDALHKQITEAAEDWEFLTAEYLIDSYREAKKKFDTVSAIKNNNHRTISFNEYMIGIHKKSLNRETEEYRQKIDKESIAECEEKIRRLKAEKNELRPETSNLKDAIEQLYDQNIRNIQLVLKEKYEASLHLSLHENNIKIALECNGNEGYLDCNFDMLKSLGFNQEASNYIYVFKDATEQKTGILLTFLSRCIFDVFHVESLDNPMKLIVS